jgi:hypothetical protein
MRLVSELLSLIYNLSQALPVELLHSAESHRLSALMHLLDLLTADMVSGVLRACSVQDLFPAVVRLLAHCEATLRDYPLPEETDGILARKVPAWLGPCIVLLDCAERATLFINSANPASKDQPVMRWEIQAFARPQMYDFIDHGWQPLSPMSMAMLEREFTSGSRTGLVQIDGHQCLVDFASMTAQVDASRDSLTVRRIPENRHGRSPIRQPSLPPRTHDFAGLSSEDKYALVSVCAKLAKAPLDSFTSDSLSLLAIRLTRSESAARIFFDEGGLEAIANSRQDDSSHCFLSVC